MKIQNFIAIFVLAAAALSMVGCGSEEPDSTAASLPGRETTADPNKAADKTNAAAQGTAAPQ